MGQGFSCTPLPTLMVGTCVAAQFDFKHVFQGSLINLVIDITKTAVLGKR